MVSTDRKLLGQILCDLGYTTEDRVQAALERQAMTEPAQAPPLIGEVLVEMGAVTDDQVRDALAAQGKTVPEHAG
ncbi:MAG: hypothetical protein WEB00_10655 [Dehalococcoidia bacterium]